MRLVTASLLVGLGLSQPVFADITSLKGGFSLGLTTEEDHGARQTAGFNLEAGIGNAYAGLSYDLYNDMDLNELDLTLGYRSMMGAATLDGSYTRYIYPEDGGDCCGGIKLALSVPMGAATAGAEFNHLLGERSSDAKLSLDMPLAFREGLSLNGFYKAIDNDDGQSGEVEIGARYQLGAATAIAAHVNDGTAYKPYLGVDLTWDFSLLGG